MTDATNGRDAQVNVVPETTDFSRVEVSASGLVEVIAGKS